ncbi:MAG TPA: hypothetical protein VK700_12360 [Steroidobacteraceae bacterium]|jgi:hypothetical protein|nr:hypothetical protein [Steroidobacteraceae bacterium]
MKAVFIELPAFERHREEYLDDDSFRGLQLALMGNPEAGDQIVGTGVGCGSYALATRVEAKASAVVCV